MSIDEYSLYAHGYFMRVGRSQEGIRRLFQVVWNSNCSKSDRIRTSSQLKRIFPLAIDKLDKEVIISQSDMTDRWNKAKEIEKRMKKQKDARNNAEYRN